MIVEQQTSQQISSRLAFGFFIKYQLFRAVILKRGSFRRGLFINQNIKEIT